MAAVREVLRRRGFRRIWYATALSSLGDWLGLLATTALAASLATSYQGQNYALGLVLLVRLLPSVLLGPLAGAFADRFDRRRTMVLSDLLRFLLFVSIPIAMTLHLSNHQKLMWLYVGSFAVECVSLFWTPAKDASVPNLVRRDQLEAANQLGLITTYGLTSVGAAILFAGLDIISRYLKGDLATHSDQVSLSLYFNAATFVIAAAICATVPELSRGGRGANRPANRATDQAGNRPADQPADRPADQPSDQPGLLAMLGEGMSFLRTNLLLRGVIIGIVGAFAAGGGVIGAGHTYVTSLGAGNASYGVLFGAVFVGLGIGMAVAPRVARDMSRRRVFGLSIVLAGFCLVLTSLAPHVVLAIVAVVGVGFGGGVAFLTGLTLLGSEIADQMRGRVFAFIQSLVRIVLILSLAVVPFVVGGIGQRRTTLFGAGVTIDGTRIVLLIGGLLAMLAGVAAYRAMDDRGTVSVLTDVGRVFRRRNLRPTSGGIFIAFEGGEGVGKSTQIGALTEYLRGEGHPVRRTFEPGATPAGQQIRRLVLTSSDALDARAEALLFAADRADHVAKVIKPALEAGEIVLTDRFVDSSLAYQGAGRSLSVDEVRALSRWAIGDLTPDLTIVLDLPAAEGLARAGERGTADRLESESLQFHDRVREAFLSYAAADPHRYVVLDASAATEEVTAAVVAAVAVLLEGRPPGPGRDHHRAAMPTAVDDGSNGVPA